MITKVLSDLHQITCDANGFEYQTHSFPKIYRYRIVHGEIPNYFLIRKYDEKNPKAKAVERFDDLFGVPKEHLAILMKYCGDSLWHLVHKLKSNNEYGVSSEQLLSVCYQVTLALAVAECVYQFEHRDLHVCNLLVKKTKKEYVTFVIRSVTYRVKSYGVKASIIDATFSRVRVGANIYFTDLSNRLKATAANQNPDSQEVAYQQMYKRIYDKWRDWFPDTNIIWLKYFYHEVYETEAFSSNCDITIKRNLISLIDSIGNYHTLTDFVQNMFRYSGESSSNSNTSNSQSNTTNKRDR